MLVTMNEVLHDAKKGHYAVGLFNAVSLELAQGIIAAAEETGSPVIFGTAEVLLPYNSLEDLAMILIPMAKRAKVPVVVHLDHGLHKETCLKALKLGFSSIMYDCSTDPYEINCERVREMTEIAHSYGASIEGEIGHVGGAEGAATAEQVQDASKFYTTPEEAKDFVDRTGVDALAIAVGTAHGAYKLPPKLDFDRIRKIAATVPTPLVLHGGSGLTDDDFRKAIEAGISKVNIFTDINVAAVEAFFANFTSMGKGIIDLLPTVREAVKISTIEKMRLFGSCGTTPPTASSVDEATVRRIVEEIVREMQGR
ncbi:MAG: class II fructose-bisphosphate aldolase [Clostridia bacterium]|nr:class II fructose-bisphosphate aldolase [Clostridia bacterium]